jgi:hypothetical protein
MTTEQKNKIVSMRKAGHGYTAVAREVGLSKSAVSNFCRENGLAGKAYIIEETGKKDLLSVPHRVKVGPEKKARSLENKGYCAILINTASSELVTIRTVPLLNGEVHQKLRRSF